ncbi:MAG: M56 family metallopeptidase [Longimicrobiaceae bacterium]
MSTALSLPPEAAFAVELVAKATLVLLAAAAAAGVVALRGGSAAARHLAWTLGVCGVLALPLLAAALPAWRTPLLTVAPPPAAAPSPALAAAPAAASPVVFASAGQSGDAATPRSAPNPISRQPGGDGPANGMGMGMTIVAAWLLGALAVLGRLAIGRWGAARLGSQAEPVTDPAWTALLRGLSRELGLARPVRLLRGGGATMPMTWGIVRPFVLLPTGADAWPEDRRRVVLMHELAHVARHDCLTQTLAAAACALYWFHPAAWYAARRLRVERELACDDRVLQAGTRARDYAGHLLEVARAFRPARLAAPVAVSMARPSQLEGRLLAVLDSVRDRRMPGRAAASAAAALAFALLLPLAAIRPGNAQQTPARQPPPVPPGTVFFGGPKPWKDSARVKPPRSPDAYEDLDAALRQGGSNVAIPARPGERLTLRLPDRVSARVQAWDRPYVHVRIDDPGLRLSGERGAGGPHVTVTGVPRTHGPDPHVRIQAPRDFDVDVQANGGGVEIGALNGTFTGSVNGGGLAFLGTRGTVRMTARGGGAVIQDAHLGGRLEMDGGGVMLNGNTGNLDVTGAGATVVGSPGRRMRVDGPPAEGSSADDEVACRTDGTCTITSRPAEGRAARTSVSTGRGGGAVTVTAGSGRATAIATGPARASTVTVAGTPARTSVGVRAAGTGEATTVRAVSSSGASTTTVNAGGGQAVTTTVATGAARGSATTIRAWDGSTTRDRDGFAFATGDVEGRIEALRAMARNAPPEAAADGLARLAYSDEDVRVQRAAVAELARLRTREAAKHLGRISRRHPDASVRAQAAAAIR